MEQPYYHFIGIGGIGMAALASLVLSKGAKVSGSDVKDSPLIGELRRRGADITIGHRPENIRQPDVVVISSAIGDDNPELRQARRAELTVLKRATLLSRLMARQQGVTVAGAHGKTTTSSMIAHILVEAELNPTVAVGGIMRGMDANAFLGEGKYFVAELDESDGSFLMFRPWISVLTNVDFEHVDYYRSWDEVIAAFRQFAHQTDPDGVIIYCGEDERLRTIVRQSGRRARSYGLSPQFDIYAQVANAGTPVWDVFIAGKKVGSMCLQVPGRHNVLNALAAVAAAHEVGLDFHVTTQALGGFLGVKRRMEFKGSAQDVDIYDDYGHHPTEIAATIDAAQGLKRGRLLTVFQPHRFSRTKTLMLELGEALKRSDELLITDIYAASEPPIAGVSSANIVAHLQAGGYARVKYLKKEALVSELLKECRAGDMVLTLGAGDISLTGEQLLERLQQTAGLGASRGFG